MNIAAVVSVIFGSIYAVLSVGKNFENEIRWDLAQCAFTITLFVLNAITIVYYYQTIDFFIEILQDNPRDKRRFK